MTSKAYQVKKGKIIIYTFKYILTFLEYLKERN